jgi:uncharacterized protein (TIGR02453 family)
MTFTGFPKETFAFLSGLERNNTKAWFEVHREDYEAYHLAPAKAFVEAIGPGLRKISKTVHAEPKVNGSIFRINRDIRFSKDKRPYKTTLDLWFWEGEARGWEAPGFYVRLTPTRFIAGAGLHQFNPAQLKAWRAALDDDKASTALKKVLDGVGDLQLGEATRKRLPKGVPADHPRAPLFLHEGLALMQEGPLPKSVSTPKFVDDVLAVFARAAPVNGWIAKHILS